ncbi:potassium transporter Kup [Phreatobacter oligotrophus]|uniref:Probable potassium transport system protein Kup n=1 Tax=Phreatobacter oligotrophus TaxID=1122261 RepID=A0A2T4Z0Z3_9HYPH|nr:potassium transporter Kup [Phreatobacter oligotrophus]PTM53392.1 KUP system potassium uptake protein [Phreatobacter oligotrophus]
MAHDRTTGSAPVEQGGEAVAKAPASGEATHAVDANGHNGGPAHTQASFWGLLIGSIGVVYGDIGTSPLYAFREAVTAAVGPAGGAPSREIVLGVLSLILWSLILIITIKYVLLLLRADDKGEGGILTLVALAQRVIGKPNLAIALLGMAGGALFYGDAAITPAISVLSALEGLKLVTPVFEPYILPLTVVIIIALFAVQSRGTASVARFFGPICIVWFIAMALIGLIHIADDFGVFLAFNPYYGVVFLANNGTIGLLALGAVFLAVTGGEALYADLGHFGRKSIQWAWFVLIFPALTLNYLGQGAMVLADPSTMTNPFYLLAPSWALLPMVVLATLATIIASQAVITGAFSLTRQAIQLGLLPRMAIRHTSEEHSGQIYMPAVNWALLAGVLTLVLLFKSSSNLAHAYGLAVTATMFITAILTTVVIRRLWKWNALLVALLMVPLITIDFVFLSANMMKLLEGGWVPLVIAFVIMFLMLTWRKGTDILAEKTRRIEVPLVDLLKSFDKRPPHQVAGTAVFLTSDQAYAPASLLHNLKHNKVLHEHNVFLAVKSVDTPRVPDSDRVSFEKINDRFSRLTVRFGYMETPHVPKALIACKKLGLKFDMMSTSFFLSRRHLKASGKLGMPLWQDYIFIGMAVNANSASDYFHLPTGRVVEVGTQVTI